MSLQRTRACLTTQTQSRQSRGNVAVFFLEHVYKVERFCHIQRNVMFVYVQATEALS